MVSLNNDSFCISDRGFLSIFINKGDGTFKARQDYEPRGCSPTSVVVGDFNHDGNLDAAIVDNLGPNRDFPGDMEIFLGKGDGTFQPPDGLRPGWSSVEDGGR